MSHRLRRALRMFKISCGVGLALLVACRRSAQPPATPAEVQSAIRNAFQTGDPKAMALASNVVAAIQTRKTAEAFMDLNALSTAPGLTDGQRITAAQSRAALSRELQAQADRGDKEAAQVLQLYQSSR